MHCVNTFQSVYNLYAIVYNRCLYRLVNFKYNIFELQKVMGNMDKEPVPERKMGDIYSSSENRVSVFMLQYATF